jgi:hypothetical protein
MTFKAVPATGKDGWKALDVQRTEGFGRDKVASVDIVRYWHV